MSSILITCWSCSEPKQTKNPSMHDSGDADVDGEVETIMCIGQGYLLRVVDVLKPEGIMEIEVEVLGLRSSTLRQAEPGKRHANDWCE